MTAPPAVTVLLPVFNGERHLAEALDSVLVQTFTDFEFLVIDDGSTDGCRDILSTYARRDSRVRVERQLGYKHAKYLTGIEAVASLEGIEGGKGGYWEDRGYHWYAGA